uniref:CRC domain-containing protein n=1 Tax=Romanomermis culicivorax TaxID=13658 RepID=A0A915JZX6_ROMCU
MSSLPSKKGTIVLKGNQLVWIPASTGVAAASTSSSSSLVESGTSAAPCAQLVTRIKTTPVANVTQLTQKSPIKVQLIRMKDGIKLADRSISESTLNLETPNSYNKDFIAGTSFFAKPAKTTTRILLRGHGQTPEAEVQLGGTSQPYFFIDSIDASIPLESQTDPERPNVTLPKAQFFSDKFSPAAASQQGRNLYPITHKIVLESTTADQTRKQNYQTTFSSIKDENSASNNACEFFTLCSEFNEGKFINFVSKLNLWDDGALLLHTFREVFFPGLSNHSRSLPSNITPTRTNVQDRATLPLVYFTAVDNVLEESVGGPLVGANSLHTMSLNELPHLNQKYCECFANGEFCKNCNCTNCKNVMTSENDRSRAIRSCLERNPMAFQPKIGKGRADTDRLHSKGCNCKKSSCLKNYCECYEAKVACTAKCKCVSCRNTETDRLHNKLTRPSLGLFAPSVLGAFGPEGDAAAAWCNTQTAASSSSRRLPLSLSPTSSLDRFSTTSDDPTEEKFDLKKMPWYYLNDDVVQATTLCMVAQADQLENQMAVLNEIEDQVDSKQKFDDICIQKAVLREFGIMVASVYPVTTRFCEALYFIQLWTLPQTKWGAGRIIWGDT